MKKLTERQRKFCEAFAANGGNSTDAARLAGYKQPHMAGPRMMENDGIQRELESMRQSTTNQAIADRERRQIFWTSIMDDPDQAMRDRLRASEILGKAQGDFIERFEEVTPESKRPTPEQLAEARRQIHEELGRKGLISKQDKDSATQTKEPTP